MRKIRQFPSATAQGVYNACRMLLSPDNGHQPLIEYADPKPDAKSDPFRPALWLAVVGRDGVWPLTPLSLASSVERPDVESSDAKRSAVEWPAKRLPSKLPLLVNPSRGWARMF